MSSSLNLSLTDELRGLAEHSHRIRDQAVNDDEAQHGRYISSDSIHDGCLHFVQPEQPADCIRPWSS